MPLTPYLRTPNPALLRSYHILYSEMEEEPEENDDGEEDDEDEEEYEEEEEGGSSDPAAVKAKMNAVIHHMSGGPVGLRVNDVVIGGNTKTLDSFIEAEVLDAFRSASTMQELLHAARIANASLCKLNIFESMFITLNVGSPELPGSAHVVINVGQEPSHCRHRRLLQARGEVVNIPLLTPLGPYGPFHLVYSSKSLWMAIARSCPLVHC